MKGMVFTAFLEMVEEKFSLQIADSIIEASKLPSGGAYTSLGTYSHEEIISLVVQLAEQTGIPVPDLVREFGEYLFIQLAGGHPQFVNVNKDAFDFLNNVDKYIHVEVRKLYPGAELPAFSYESPSPNVLIMTYRSLRPFADLAEGLIIGSIRHFGENITIERTDLENHDGTASQFTMTKQEMA
jgi:hypothetical protein